MHQCLPSNDSPYKICEVTEIRKIANAIVVCLQSAINHSTEHFPFTRNISAEGI